MYATALSTVSSEGIVPAAIIQPLLANLRILGKLSNPRVGE
jgi:hypothetical protein